MQITALISLLPFLTGALALPVTDFPSSDTISNATLLEKRVSNRPWIGTFDPPDVECKAKGGPSEATKQHRPKLYQDGEDKNGNVQYKCRKFVRDPNRNAQVFWGTEMYQVNEVAVFYDEHCKEYAHTFTKGDVKVGKSGKSCYDLHGDGRPFKSVKSGWH